jgi:ABC-2 type transport system ATP-binding protein
MTLSPTLPLSNHASIAADPRPSAPVKARQTAPDFAIEASGLVKTYPASRSTPEKTALKGIDLVVPRGSIFGLLGPNGAGKSTFINILAGLVLKTAGTVKIWGVDIDQAPRTARAAIGVVPQEIVTDVFFTPRESLEVQAGFYGVRKKDRKTDEILAALGLTDKADAYVRQLSGGMKRRLMVAKAMVHQPPILILDEPTAGVDVELRAELWEYIRRLHADGTTILLTTHYLEEAEELCEEIALIRAGRLIARDTADNLRADFGAADIAGVYAQAMSAVADGFGEVP